MQGVSKQSSARLASLCSSTDEEDFVRAGSSALPPDSPFQTLDKSHRFQQAGNGSHYAQPAKRQRRVHRYSWPLSKSLFLRRSSPEQEMLLDKLSVQTASAMIEDACRIQTDLDTFTGGRDAGRDSTRHHPRSRHQ